MTRMDKRPLADPPAIAFSRRAAMTAVASIGFLALSAMSDGAQAYFKICNHTGSSLDVAIAYGVKDAPGTSTGGHLGVTAEGWWTFAPQECGQVSGIHAGNHWLYYRGEAKTGSSDGRSLLCVPQKPFTLPGQQFRRAGDRCPKGQRLAGFKRIDATKKNHVLNVK